MSSFQFLLGYLVPNRAARSNLVKRERIDLAIKNLTTTRDADARSVTRVKLDKSSTVQSTSDVVRVARIGFIQNHVRSINQRNFGIIRALKRPTVTAD
jgi:hypothetical protein